MLNILKQTIMSLRDSWGTNDDRINMTIFQTMIDYCEQHNDLGHSNVEIKHELFSGDVKLAGMCEATPYESNISIVMSDTEYVEAIENNTEDRILTHMLTVLVHEYRHSYQHINRLPMVFVKYTEAGTDMDSYLEHPQEVDAYAWEAKLADEAIEYVVNHLVENYNAEHEFMGSYHTSYVFEKDPTINTEDSEDWEYEMMYEDYDDEF